MTNKVHDARRFLIDEDKEVTAQAIKNYLVGIDDRKMLVEVFREHNEGIAAHVRLYLVAILVGCFSAIMALMFFWMELH